MATYSIFIISHIIFFNQPKSINFVFEQSLVNTISIDHFFNKRNKLFCANEMIMILENMPS